MLNYHNDALNCPKCQEKDDADRKMKVMQGAAFPHEGVLVYWRRKKCLHCGYLMRTVEVPADRVNSFYKNPDIGEMTAHG